eukprot:7170100-Ditylum_brightwellii.AAC.1
MSEHKDNLDYLNGWEFLDLEDADKAEIGKDRGGDSGKEGGEEGQRKCSASLRMGVSSRDE